MYSPHDEQEWKEIRRRGRARKAAPVADESPSKTSSEAEVVTTTKKKRTETGKCLDKIAIGGSFLTHLNLEEWDHHVMNACFQAGGHTDQ